VTDRATLVARIDTLLIQNLFPYFLYIDLIRLL